MGLLSGKTALITGAGRGIGAALARGFAREGARLILNDLGCDRAGEGRDPDVIEKLAAEIRQEGGEVRADANDVSTEAGVEALFSSIESDEGDLDILVNNAGIIRDGKLFDMSVADFDAVVTSHLRGTFLCTRAMAAVLRKKRHGGQILNMTSVSGLLGNLGQMNESASKAGIYGLTRTASIELQKYRICVNALAPIARTRLTEDLPMFEKVTDTLEPEHIVPAALYLVSDLAEELSGSVLSVAGGRISLFELKESQGRVKEVDGGLWKPEEIAEHFDSIARW